MKRKLRVLCIILMTIVFAQSYYPVTQYLLENDFSENEKFLNPNRSYFCETNDDDLLWVDADSLSNIYFNPALLQFQTKSKLYLSFNDNLEKDIFTYSYPYPCYGGCYLDCIMPVSYKIFENVNVEPIFNLFAIKKLKKLPLTLGIAYNLKWYKDDDMNEYYYPYYSNTMISNIYLNPDGKNDILQNGHNLDFFTAYKYSEHISLGLNLSFVMDKYRNDYKYDYDAFSTEYLNFQKNKISENRTLHQYELNSGAIYKDKNNSYGLNFGWIHGNNNQNYTALDTLESFSGIFGSDVYNINNRKFINSKKWDHKGNTFHVDLMGDHKFQNMMVLYKADYLINRTDVENSAMADENYFYENNQINYYTKSTTNNDYQIKGDGNEEFQKRSVASAMRLYTDKNFISVGLVYTHYQNNKKIKESGNKEYYHNQYNEAGTLENSNIETQKVITEIKTNIEEELYKIPVCLLLTNSRNLKFKISLVTILGYRKKSDNIFADHLEYYFDYNGNINTNSENQLFKNDETKNINQMELNFFVEYDFYTNLTLFLTIHNYLGDRKLEWGNNYFYTEDTDIIDCNDWRFGLIYNF